VTASSERVSLAAAVATLLSALTLIPLISGGQWLLATVVLIAVVTASGAMARQVIRWWPVVVAVQAVCLALIITVIFARSAAIAGVFPGGDAVRLLVSTLSEGMDVARSQGPPVESTAGVALMSAGGIALVALAVDVIAVSLGRPALAGLPLLAVYCVPAALLPGGLGWFWFLLAGAGYLLLVGADAGDRVRAWGRVLSGATRRSGMASGTVEGLGRGGRRVAATSLLVAAIVPALIPGLGERLIGSNGSGQGEGNGRGDTIRVVNPILDLRQNLSSTSNAPVLSYTTTAVSPQPIRIVTDSVFDGHTWLPETGRVPGDQRVQNGLPPPPGLSSSVSASQISTTITVGALNETYLPLPYPARRVQIAGSWLYDARTLNVVRGTRRTTTVGTSYNVEHLDVQPTPEQLRDAGPAPPSITENYLGLPDLPASIRETAQRVAGTGSKYDQAVALQQFFRSSGGFVYSTEAPRSDNPQDDASVGSIAAFLTSRRGYCVHFASAMAVMARSLGIPARVAVGFLPGQSQPDGSHQVRLRDAHAWPELYFQGTGWVRFEPTPAGRVGTAPSWTLLPLNLPGATASALPTAGQSSPAVRPDKDLPTNSPATGSTRALSQVLAAIPWRFVAAAAVVLAVAASPMMAAAITRRRRWRRAGTRAQRAEAAWDDLRRRLSDLGVRWATSWTPRAMQIRVANEYRLDGSRRAALGRLVTDLESARYARPSADGGRPAAEMVADVRAVASGVAAALERRVRRRARWLPASGIEALAGLARRVDVAADDAGRRVRVVGADLGTQIGAQAKRTVGSRK
jgi:transglutaminase-like putative cysteine protease